MGNQLSLPQLRKLLEPTEAKAAEMLVEREFMPPSEKPSYEEIADELGITVRTLYNWRKRKPEFIMYVNMLVEVERESFYPTVINQLHRAIEGTSNNGVPSIRAIELWLKATGRMVERTEVVTTEVKAPTLSRKEVSEGIAKLNDIIDSK